MITRQPDGTFRIRFFDKVRYADSYEEAQAILHSLEDELNDSIEEPIFDWAFDDQA